jgi:hypothetical protein
MRIWHANLKAAASTAAPRHLASSFRLWHHGWPTAQRCGKDSKCPLCLQPSADKLKHLIRCPTVRTFLTSHNMPTTPTCAETLTLTRSPMSLELTTKALVLGSVVYDVSNANRRARITAPATTKHFTHHFWLSIGTDSKLAALFGLTLPPLL